ncbi:MAG: hypothetical protein KA965_04110 [Butyrivibrio sp.]|nr:hypothetical protein [Butyrivibrio sp.]
MTIRIILWCSIIWIAPLICLMLKKEARNKTNIVAGVTIPEEMLENDLVRAELRRYNRQQNLLCVILLLFAIPGIFMGNFDTSMTLWCIWLLPCIFLPYFLFARCHTAMKKIKLQQGWGLSKNGQDVCTDEDDKWIWGLFYYDPSNSDLLVNGRIGINLTLNMARTASKVIMAFTVLLMFAIPFFIPVTNAILDKPPVISAGDGTVMAVSGGTKYVVSADNMKSVQLLNELPEHLVRNFGTGMEDLLKGRFSSDITGKVEVCLDPTRPPFLLITTKDGNTYLFGSREQGKIEQIYTELQKR